MSTAETTLTIKRMLYADMVEEQCEAAISLGFILEADHGNEEVVGALNYVLSPFHIYDNRVKPDWLVRVHVGWALNCFGRRTPGTASGEDRDRNLQLHGAWKHWMDLPSPTWSDWSRNYSHRRWFVRLYCAYCGG